MSGLDEQDIPWADYVRQHFRRSRERADELIRIAEGDTTLTEVRQKANERKIKHRAKQSVFRNTDDGDVHLGPQMTAVYECIEAHGGSPLFKLVAPARGKRRGSR